MIVWVRGGFAPVSIKKKIRFGRICFLDTAAPTFATWHPNPAGLALPIRGLGERLLRLRR